METNSKQIEVPQTALSQLARVRPADHLRVVVQGLKSAEKYFMLRMNSYLANGLSVETAKRLAEHPEFARHAQDHTRWAVRDGELSLT